MSDSQARVEEVFAEAARLFTSKNLHYGDSWREQGWRGNLARVMSKAGRLRNMLWRGGNTLLNGSSEHPRETALDMMNTLAFMVINMDDGVEWGHEPRSDPPPAVEAQHVTEPPPWLREGASEPVTFTYSDGEPVPDQAVQERLAEQTVVMGEVPIPGEERPSPRPRSGRKHVKVSDRGNGPRHVVDESQA